MEKIIEFNLGDLVELKYQLRRPRLKGIIIKKIGYDENLSDFIYQVYCFSFKPPKKVRWSHKSLEKIS